MATRHRIDTHTHIVPPDYAAWLKRRSADAGGLPIPDWSVDLALASMEQRSVRTSIVSVSTPGVHFGDDAEARDMARAVNEYAADVVKRNRRPFRLLRDSDVAGCGRIAGRTRIRIRYVARRRCRAAREHARHIPRRRRSEATLRRTEPPQRSRVHPPCAAAGSARSGSAEKLFPRFAVGADR